MDRKDILAIKELAQSPSFVVNLESLRRNLRKINLVQTATGAKVLLALKGFAMFSVFPLLNKTLHGVCASGPFEAQLGAEEFGREVHTFAPAYSEMDIIELCRYSHHIVFNSYAQWQRYKTLIEASPRRRKISIGLRINPEHSEGATAIYNPCAPCSRLGIKYADLLGRDLTGIEGLHFHTLCEQNADALERTWEVVEKKFQPWISQLKWINFGGGHHITRDDYDLDKLCGIIEYVRKTYKIEVYLEPGEAVALNTGVLVASVMDIVENDMKIAILNVSASAHMPDVLEMPYRPRIVDAGEPGEKAYTYRLGGITCLAGDVVGDYSFDTPLNVGDRIIFEDMAHYSMVKTTMFNGVHHPSIATYEPADGSLTMIREFDYFDYRNRLS
jgi:carboxynorspermidine decarboxylase